jgi:hypothetical protein
VVIFEAKRGPHAKIKWGITNLEIINVSDGLLILELLFVDNCTASLVDY